MAEAKEIEKSEHLSMQMNGFSRDLLTKCMEKSFRAENENKEEEEIELSLGLSLNGKFGVDPKREAKQRLVRSSSIASFMLNSDEGKAHARVMPCVGYAPLMRTCSLPAEAEEEWRKRKEMQTLRRKEVKRKRMEKKNIVRVVRGKVDFVEENVVSDSVNGDGSISNGDEQGLVSINVMNGIDNHHDCNNGLQSSQGSLGSQGSGSSGISDLESQPMQAVNKNTEVRSPSGAQSLQEQNEQKIVVGAAQKEVKEAKEILKDAVLDMPCVSTRGDGPNGKKIDGFLYKFRNGEEVSIVCVCHGSFLTPAEFVKHAGGGDVAHPLRHIVVNPSPFL